MENLKSFLTVHKVTVILIAFLILLLMGGVLAYQKINNSKNALIEEIDLPFDAEGPYGLLFPRRDGNALVLNIKRTSSYDGISYDLSYTSNPDEIAVPGRKVSGDGESLAGGSIDRGVSGTIDTKDKKGEYEQEILFGTCSKNVCKYDKGVENGTLILKIKKGLKIYRMVTIWHLQKPDVVLGILTSGDGHFIYKMGADRQLLSNVGFSIVNDLTGLPKLPVGKQVLGKVYSLNVPIAKDLPGGEVSLELVENPPEGAKLFRFDGSSWQELETKVMDAKLSSKAAGAGIFAVLIPNK